MFPYGIRRVDGVMIPRWDDIRFAASSLTRAGGNDPFASTWQPGGSGTAFHVWTFNNNDEMFFLGQLPHGYVLCTDLEAHIHWTPRDRGVIEDTKTVAWKVDAVLVNEGDVALPSTTLDLTDTCDGVDDKHVDTPSVVIDCSSIDEPSAMVIGRVYRDAGDTWAGNIAAQAPALLEVDFHLQIDDVGSLQRHVKR